MKLNNFKKYFLIGVQILIVSFFISCNNPNNANNTESKKSSTLENNTAENKSAINDFNSQKQSITSPPITTGRPSVSEVISDVSSWNHPVKEVFNQYNIKIKKVELLNNKEFPIFYVEINPFYKLDSQNAEYFDVLLKKIASANGYWDFKVIDDKNKLIFYVLCNKENKTVKEIVANDKKGLLKEMIDYNNEMKSEYDKVIAYLTQNVPEIKKFEEQITKGSEGKMTLIVRLDGVPDKYSDSKYKDYYCIYVGESHLDHSVRWNSFYVNEELNKIMVENIVNGDLLTLEQWRENYKG